MAIVRYSEIFGFPILQSFMGCFKCPGFCGPIIIERYVDIVRIYRQDTLMIAIVPAVLIYCGEIFKPDICQFSIIVEAAMEIIHADIPTFGGS